MSGVPVVPRAAAPGSGAARTVTALALVAGLVLLVAGGEALVRGGSRLGLRLGMSPLVIGLTIVAAATSAPELAAWLR